jgi:hypothetical protein
MIKRCTEMISSKSNHHTSELLIRCVHFWLVQGKVEDAVKRARSKAVKNMTDPDGKAEIEIVIGVSFVPKWVVKATEQGVLLPVAFTDGAHMTNSNTLYSTITTDANRKNVGMCYRKNVGMCYSIINGNECATGWNAHHGIMVRKIPSVVSPDRRVIGDGNSSLRSSVVANGMTFVRCGKHYEKGFSSKNDKDVCFTSPLFCVHCSIPYSRRGLHKHVNNQPTHITIHLVTDIQGGSAGCHQGRTRGLS